MNRRSCRPLIASLAALLFVLACEIPVAPTPAISNSPPGSIETIIFETAAAAQTQTLYAIPATETETATLPPTRTPTDTPTPTETIIIKLPTATPSPTDTPGPISAGTGCVLVAQNPANNETIAPKTNFDMQWTLKNTGSEIWGHGDYDFEYISGAKIYKAKRYDLPSNVEPNNEVTITVKMKAPEARGTYTTTWALSSGNTSICTVSLTIIVK
jgi:hypothetical protein